MLSKTNSTLLRFICKWTSFLGGMPFHWDERRSQIRISEKGWAKWTFWVVYLTINWTSYVAKLVYVLLTSKRATQNGELDPALYIYEKVKGYQVMIVYAIGILISINTWSHMEEIAAFVNSFIRYSQHFRNAYIKRLGRGWRNGCETILRLLTMTMFVIPLLACGHFIADPGDLRYLTSILPPPPMTPLVLYVALVGCFGVLQTLWSFSCVSVVIFYATMNILPAYVSFQMLNEIKAGNYYHISKPLVRRPPRLCGIYRSLQLLTRLWNDALTSCTYPLKAAAESFSIAGNSLLIKFFRLESPLGCVLLVLGPNIYLATWLLSLALWGSLAKRSRAVVGSWSGIRLKLHGDTILLRKFARSAPPLGIRIGRMYTVRSGRVVITVHSVVKSTFKFLLTIKKKIRAGG